MPEITRRSFTRAGMSGMLALFAPASLYSCAALHSRSPIAGDLYTDKLKGMILLGAYGDALGAYHEPRGLQGITGNPETTRRLPKAISYQPPGSQATPWWVWIQGDDLAQDVIGLPTDDSAFRMLILHPWLLSLGDDQPSEALFQNWMQARVTRERPFSVNQWQSRRQAQIRDWLIMLNDAKRWNESPEIDPVGFTPTEGNPFFRPTIPIVFGLFMYLELAALYAGYKSQAIMNHFSSFSQLDQGYAQAITGLFAGLIASAIPVDSSQVDFSYWYKVSIQDLLSHNVLYRELMNGTFNTAWQVGTANQHLSEEAFLDVVKKEIYDAPLPGNRDTIGFRVFDPLLFFKQITATVAYAGADTYKALVLLANHPGDSDTLPSMLGSLIGVWTGSSMLQQLSPELKEDLHHVQHTLHDLFGYDVEQTAKELTLAAKRIQYINA